MIRQAMLFTLLSMLLTAAHAEELGRLFYTPQQRAQLDAQQQTGAAGSDGVKRSYIMINGLIQKPGGKRIAWVNGTQQPAGIGSDRSPATVSVTVPGKSEPVQLKVGQRLILNTIVEENSEESASGSAKPAATKRSSNND